MKRPNAVCSLSPGVTPIAASSNAAVWRAVWIWSRWLASLGIMCPCERW